MLLFPNQYTQLQWDVMDNKQQNKKIIYFILYIYILFYIIYSNQI